MRFAGRTVAITGGTKGIGEGCVEVFAEAGADVVFCGLEQELGETVAERVSAAGPGKARFVPCNVTRHDQLHAFIQSAVDGADAVAAIDPDGRLVAVLDEPRATARAKVVFAASGAGA